MENQSLYAYLDTAFLTIAATTAALFARGHHYSRVAGVLTTTSSVGIIRLCYHDAWRASSSHYVSEMLIRGDKRSTALGVRT